MRSNFILAIKFWFVFMVSPFQVTKTLFIWYSLTEENHFTLILKHLKPLTMGSNKIHFSTEDTQNTAAHTIEDTLYVTSGSTHPEDIKEIVPQGPETICTPLLWTQLSKMKSISNCFALGFRRIHLKWEQFAALMQLFHTSLILRGDGLTDLRRNSTTMWISTGCVCSLLHCRKTKNIQEGSINLLTLKDLILY